MIATLFVSPRRMDFIAQRTLRRESTASAQGIILGEPTDKPKHVHQSPAAFDIGSRVLYGRYGDPASVSSCTALSFPYVRPRESPAGQLGFYCGVGGLVTSGRTIPRVNARKYRSVSHTCSRTFPLTCPRARARMQLSRNARSRSRGLGSGIGSSGRSFAMQENPCFRGSRAQMRFRPRTNAAIGEHHNRYSPANRNIFRKLQEREARARPSEVEGACADDAIFTSPTDTMAVMRERHFKKDH